MRPPPPPPLPLSLLLPLLLLLPVVAPAAPAATAAESDPPALLVLRAACSAPLRRIFDETEIRRRALDRPQLAARRLRLLPYEETCGAEWRTTVTRAALAALSSGAAVLSVGWPGAGACGALLAGARALRRPAPGACAAAEARGAAAAALALRLGWRRALLPPAAPRSECGAALRDVARALAAAGLLVRRAAPAPAELARLPHGACPSTRPSVVRSRGDTEEFPLGCSRDPVRLSPRGERGSGGRAARRGSGRATAAAAARRGAGRGEPGPRPRGDRRY
ncbi:uncharacterized protein LOC142986137 [Anticarsia gemmatalis]|uniref:uncharacterized protein LOC142986137 n=1 Tax=Anticarsia gemmatalis TaxID=129554 RepID=UPI003F773063